MTNPLKSAASPDIVSWLDPLSFQHACALIRFKETGKFPEGFLADFMYFPDNWEAQVDKKFEAAYASLSNAEANKLLSGVKFRKFSAIQE